MPRPNILFLLTDNQRADLVGCAGNSIIKTPNLDLLGYRGVRFAAAAEHSVRAGGWRDRGGHRRRLDRRPESVLGWCRVR